MSLEPGQIIDGKYRVGRLIGEGGMGTVYEGENSRIGRRVAIKVLHAHVASMPEFVERFEREARASARIGSPHVCDVLDLGDLPGGDRYIVMEYLDGVSFEDRIVDRGKLTAAQLAPIAFELLEGLGTMHLARVIHRDLKPANVFLARTPSGRGEIVKILDFGVAKLQPFEGEVGNMTQTGSMMGTPLYMSPEQARGARDVDGRTDIYAASVMFYRALAGVLPYMAETLNELLFKIVLEEPRPLRDLAPEIDEVFAAIVHKGLARDLAQRFQSAREYQEAIAAWGKTQGRSSLSFAVTMQSEPPEPPSGPQDAPMPVPTPRAIVRPSDGTPTAWSEDGPEAARRASSNARVAAVRPAAGAPSDPALARATVASANGAAGADGAGATRPPDRPASETGARAMSASSSTVAMKSAPVPGALAAAPEAIPANAITSPRVDLPGPAAHPRSAPTSRRVVVAIGVGAVGAIALAGFFAFGRGATSSPGAGLTPATLAAESRTAASAASSGAQPEAALRAPSAPSSTVDPATATTGTTTPSAPAGSTSALPSDTPTASPTGVRRDPPPAITARKAEAKAPPAPGSSTAGASTAQASPTATVVAPVASATPTKPAASAARKFRTNLD